ncbi:peptidase E [Sediminihabitans luteus]|uniref:Peptidase E n=1 Tax=Sediminihabitans luteus TaxID=1138585 RepID=A0A2M9CR38_9CELL|nr:peptidase E [Sediminihabitans luteus]PJJ74392.1 peptidase E [Sediminihabitans luteus]GIJ00241.1 putative peptidase YgaJ [Sediminihabitans luteus]
MTTRTGTFLTLGGGGFSMPDVAGDRGPLLDDFLLSLARTDDPRVCFVGTASGDAAVYAERFLAAFEGRAQARVLSLFGSGPEGSITVDRLKEVLEQDVVYVGGGSTANLLALWRLHGLDTLLARAAARGTIMAGISAGMNCWYEGSSTDSFGPLAALPDGLGLLPGSACPHYLGEADRRAGYRAMVAGGALGDGYAADDGVALLWRDGELVEAVSERPDGQAFRVVREGDGAVETPIAVRFLG